MNEHLRDRILRRISALPDERGYQILDYVEYLESKFGERQNPDNLFTRVSDGLTDGLRAGRVSAGTIAGSVGVLRRLGEGVGAVSAAARGVARGAAGLARAKGSELRAMLRVEDRARERFGSAPVRPAAGGVNGSGVLAIAPVASNAGGEPGHLRLSGAQDVERSGEE